MSGAVLRSKAFKPTRGRLRRWTWPFRALVRFLDWLFLSPFRLYISIRGQMTGASVTLLVVGITTINIVWGYPWNGMFAACAALLLVGWMINRIMAPRLAIDFSLPASAPAGQPFSLVMHVVNQGRLPAMDLQIDYKLPPKLSRRRRRRSELPLYQSLDPANGVSLIYPGEQIDLDGQLVFHRRGVFWVPAVMVTSLFPFHLFRYTARHISGTSIPITPKLMTGDEDEVSHRLLNMLGGWSHRLLSGDALDYTGSREYEFGMPVRRWDFTSWARLGRPIVREFQSPSVQVVLLVIDMCPPPEERSDQGDPVIERLLSFAATAVTELTRKMVLVRMVTTHESPSSANVSVSSSLPTDAESLLIRLAGAKTVSPAQSNECIDKIFEHIGRAPALLLTTRPENELPAHPSRNVTVIRVDSAHSLPPATAAKPAIASDSTAHHVA